MAKSASLNITLAPELDDRLAAVAVRLDRPKSWVVEQAVREFLDLQSWHLAAIEEGIRDANAGRIVPHDKVVAWVESWGRPDEKPMPECK
jgi:predicted transcriptional regulator